MTVQRQLFELNFDIWCFYCGVSWFNQGYVLRLNWSTEKRCGLSFRHVWSVEQYDVETTGNTSVLSKQKGLSWNSSANLHYYLRELSETPFMPQLDMDRLKDVDFEIYCWDLEAVRDDMLSDIKICRNWKY